mgnify:CR=1 FL=1
MRVPLEATQPNCTRNLNGAITVRIALFKFLVQLGLMASSGTRTAATYVKNWSNCLAERSLQQFSTHAKNEVSVLEKSI